MSLKRELEVNRLRLEVTNREKAWYWSTKGECCQSIFSKLPVSDMSTVLHFKAMSTVLLFKASRDTVSQPVAV